MKEHPKLVAATGKQIAELQRITEQGITDVHSICVLLSNAYEEGNDNVVYTIATTEEKISRIKKFIAAVQDITALW